ncbi:unnamed protein product, partial [Rotaria sp. Silwood2]
VSTNQPCQTDIYLKTTQDFSSIDNTTRFKVSLKSISNEPSTYQHSYHLINDDFSIHLNNLCKDSYNMNNTHSSLNVSVLSSTEILVQWNVNQILPSMNYRIRWTAANETNKEKI